MFFVLNLLGIIYSAENPLDSMWNDLKAIQNNVEKSAEKTGSKIERVVAESDEDYTLPDGSQCKLNEWYKNVPVSFLQSILTCSRIFFTELVSNLQQLIADSQKQYTQQHFVDITQFKDYLE